MPLTESRAQQTIFFSADPAVVADACKNALDELGRVDVVSRETGVISGRMKVSWGTNWVFMTVTVARKDAGTQLDIQAQRKEGLITGGGAQQALALFAGNLGARLKGQSTAGW